MSNSPFWHNLFRSAEKQRQSICDLWLDTPIFEGISHHHCLKLVNEMSIRRYQVDEAIFTQGEIGIGTCLILKGDVQICSGNKVLATIEEGDFFGATLSLNSNIIAVGAVYDDVMGSNSGSVSLFSYDNNTWIETEKIVAFDGMEYDFFGNAIETAPFENAFFI